MNVSFYIAVFVLDGGLSNPSVLQFAKTNRNTNNKYGDKPKGWITFIDFHLLIFLMRKSYCLNITTKNSDTLLDTKVKNILNTTSKAFNFFQLTT